jgi:hypothetical protein
VTYYWDEEDQVYRDEDGHKLRDAALAALLTLLISKISRRLERIEEDRRSGRMFETEAQHLTGREITLAHRMMAALASGGLKQLDAGARGEVDQRIDSEIRYLVRFYTQGPYLSDAQAVARISQYASATYATYQRTRAASNYGAGNDEARRVLEPGAEHCEDCVILAERDWVPISELVAIGDSECGSNCRCHLEFRQTSEAGESTTQAQEAAA